MLKCVQINRQKKTPNALKSICSNCMPIPKVWDFDEKKGSVGCP